MAQIIQQINKHQLREQVVDVSHVDVTTLGRSLITKLIPGSGLTLDSYTGADPGTGVVTLKLDETLSSLANITGTGFLIRNSNDSISTRSIGFSNNLWIENQDGLAGNPVFDLSNTGIEPGVYKYLSIDEKGRAYTGFKYLQTWVANEVVIGMGDHIHYSLSNAPVVSTVMVFVDGAKQIPGIDFDYTILSNIITFNEPKIQNEKITACYFWSENNNNSLDIQVETLPRVLPDNMKRYRLNFIPQESSQAVFLNGLLQNPGIDFDYTMEGQDVVFMNDTYLTDHVSAMYLR